MPQAEKPLVWMEGEIKSPPFSGEARIEAAVLQYDENCCLPHSHPRPDIGPRCRELPIRDQNKNGRIFYLISADAAVIFGAHNKTTQKTPQAVLENCKRHIKPYKSIP